MLKIALSFKVDNGCQVNLTEGAAILPTEAKKKKRYLYEVDLMRCIFIFGVLINHVSSLFTNAVSKSSGAYEFFMATHLMPHFTRMGFMFVTGLVLFLGNYKKDHLDIVPFWIKRFKGSGIPYVFWNGFYILITLLVMGSFTFPEWLGEWGDALLHGNRFYLYYILVTMQLYLIFPIMLWLYKRFMNRHNLIISISALIQLLFLFYIKYIFPHQDHANWSYLFRSYGMFVLTYQFYFMAGAYVSIHYDKVTTLLMTYQKRIYAITACLSLGTIGLYYYNTKILGLSRHYAHLVHQPYMMIYAIFMIATIFALSLHYAKNREKPSLQWLRRSVDLSSKLSFGIYLTQTASLAIFGLVIDWINPYLSDVALALLFPLGYLLVLGGAWLISYFCYKVSPFGILIGRPNHIKKGN